LRLHRQDIPTTSPTSACVLDLRPCTHGSTHAACGWAYARSHAVLPSYYVLTVLQKTVLSEPALYTLYHYTALYTLYHYTALHTLYHYTHYALQ
jgi:hypothetical protein